MITTAPLPLLRHLAAAIFTRSGRAPDAAWRQDGTNAFVLSRSAWSLAFLAQARGMRVVVPAWFCAQSLEPLRSVGAQIVFLPVDQGGRPRWETAPASFDLGVAVHVFGVPADMAPARAACDRAGALLVEDAAHCLAPANGIGDAGDAVLYSPYKLLGVPEGAVMVLRGPAFPMPDLKPAPSPHRWLARRMVQRLMPDRLRPLLPMGGQPGFCDDPAAGQCDPPTRISPLAGALMASADLAREASARRRNAMLLRSELAKIPGWRPFFADDDGPAPYRFVLRCDNDAIAAERYARLREAHLPVESWPDLPVEVKAAPDKYGAALELRKSLLLLPVHGALAGARFARLARKALS